MKHNKYSNLKIFGFPEKDPLLPQRPDHAADLRADQANKSLFACLPLVRLQRRAHPAKGPPSYIFNRTCTKPCASAT